MHEIIMGYQGEMSLKGLNRNQFESAMMKILRYRLKTVGKFKVYCTQSTFYMEPEEEDVDMDLAFDRVSKVFGLAALSRAVVCDKDFDTICQTAEDYLGASLHGIRTFKVEARRSDKTYPMTSPELMRELGAYLLGKHNYLKVDVHNPDFKVIVEIRDYGAYIHGPKVPGEGGLPVGTSGRALNMLSGGIDSPVAAYRMAKRGLALDHIHFASPPYTSERAKLKVKDTATMMIICSDNIATNMIIDYLGLDTINACIRELGFAHTVLHNPLHFDRYRRLGTTTPRDYAALFARIAKGELVSREASAEMFSILRQQHYNTMLTHDFPQYYLDCEETGAPELIWVASKSGSMNACRNDGGIVHTPYGEYVIVLMNKDFHDIIEYNEHPAMVYGARVSRMILDQVLACEGRLFLS